MTKDGSVEERRYLEYSLTLDERIVDGFYFSGVLRMVHELFQNPEQLDSPPARVVEDVE